MVVEAGVTEKGLRTIPSAWWTTETMRLGRRLLKRHRTVCRLYHRSQFCRHCDRLEWMAETGAMYTREHGFSPPDNWREARNAKGVPNGMAT